ncbi:YecA family protein [Clostridium sporogenes]
MRICTNCSEHVAIYNDDIDKCPICGRNLEIKLIDDDTESNTINVHIDFSYKECDCGNKLSYNEISCKQCGKSQEIENDSVDPKVKLRKEKFKDILTLINDSDLCIKNLRRNIHNGSVNRTLIEDFVAYIQIKLYELEKLTEKKLFKNISFNSDVIEKKEIENKIGEIKEYIINIYKIYEELLILEAPYVWENAFIRLCNTVRNFLDVNKLIIFSIVANTLAEACKNVELAQQKLDSASEEIDMLSNMLNIKALEEDFEMFKDGNLNIPVIMLMVLAGNTEHNQIEIKFNEVQFSAYRYFKDFLPNEFQYYNSLETPILFKLASYKFMGMTSFIESKFIEKVKVVSDLFEKAKDINGIKLKEFMNIYTSKYVYALEIVNDVTQDYILNFSYCKNKKMLVRNALNSYKDLSEGVYKDVSSLLIACAYIIDKKDINYEYILEWMGFPDKLEYLKNKKKLKLHKLTDGVEKILRHSAAHVDYYIDDINKMIILRNKISNRKDKEKIGEIEEIKYTYEEFYRVQLALQETIFSIMAGIDIFCANNYYDFDNFLLNVDKEVGDLPDKNLLEYTFPFYGIIDIHLEEILKDNKTILVVKGVSIERKDRELLEKCISCASPIVKKRNELDKIIIELVDDNNIKIGSVEIIFKYMKKYFEVNAEYKKYESLLSMMTTRINYEYNNDYIESVDNYGTKFISAILQWCLDLMEKLNETTNTINNKDIYANELTKIKKEFEYSINTINEFKSFVKDDRFLDHIKSILNNFVNAINKKIEVKCNNSIINIYQADYLYQNAFYQVTNVFAALADNEKIGPLLNDSSNNRDNVKIKVGRNDPCPCGSGKKYKKCCLRK